MGGAATGGLFLYQTLPITSAKCSGFLISIERGLFAGDKLETFASRYAAELSATILLSLMGAEVISCIAA